MAYQKYICLTAERVRSGSPTACLRSQAVVAKLLNYWLNIINIMRHIAQIWLVVVLS